MKKVIVFFAVITVCLSIMTTVASAEGEIEVTLRIEGISENIFYDNLKIIPQGEGLTVADVLAYADSEKENLEIDGIESGFVSAVNGVSGGKFGGWDGWSDLVNGEAPDVGISEQSVASGDVVVLFYSDMFGAGIQFPKPDYSNISEGIIRFTSLDASYDENFNATYSENPVVGADVLFGSDKYITDKNGEITIEKDKLTSGKHSIGISRYNDAGVPTVLRLAPNESVTISSEPETGDKGVLVYCLLAAAAVVALLVIKRNSKQGYEA